MVHVAFLGLSLSIPWRCLGEPPETDDSARYPCNWLQEFLYSPPKDLEDKGISVQATLLAPSSYRWCDEWEGRGVAGREVPPFSLKPDHLRQLTKAPELVILRHDEGWVLSSDQGKLEFGTPPRPPPVPSVLARGPEIP